MTEEAQPAVETMTWEALESERRDFLDRAVQLGLPFDAMPQADVLRFIAVSHRARMIVKPAGKPSSKPKQTKKAKTLDDLVL